MMKNGDAGIFPVYYSLKLVLTSTTACIIIRAVVLMLYIQQVGVLPYYSTIIPYIFTLVCDELPTVFF